MPTKNPIKSQKPVNININKKPENYNNKTSSNKKMIEKGEWNIDSQKLLGNTKGYEEEGV